MDVNDLIIEVRDGNLNRRNQIMPQYWVDVVINPVFNGVGAWSLTLPDEHPAVAILKAPSSGVIFTTPWWVVSGFMTDAVNDAESEDPQSTWTFSGQTDEIILDDPLLFPTPSEVDPALQEDAYNVRIGPAETIIHEYIVANIGSAAPSSRRNPYLTLGSDLGRGGSQTYSASWDIMIEAIQKIAANAALGFKVTQVADALRFDMYVPQDRSDTVRMDIFNRTLESVQYGYGAPKLTRAIVGGAGDGPYRKIKLRTSTESGDAEADWNRIRERFVDARSADTEDELDLAGDKALLDGGATITSVSVVPVDDTTMIFGKDWFLGDLVGVTVNNQPLKSIVAEGVITGNSDGMKVAAKLGDPSGFDFESILVAQINGLEQRLRDMERLVSTDPLLVRSRTGVISPLYTYGPVDVLMDGDSTYTTGVKWLTPYVPTAGDVVSMQYSDGQWMITGQVRADNDYLRPLPFVLNTAAGWTTYDANPGDPSYSSSVANASKYSPVVFTKSSAGYVVMYGLVAKTTATAAGVVIGTLPVGFRPSADLSFVAVNNSGAVRLDVKTNGDIVTGAGGAAAGYLSLANISFNTVATYTPLTLINSWVPFGGTFRTPGIYEDPYGLVTLSGAAKSGTNSASTIMSNSIPAGSLPSKSHYIALGVNNTLGASSISGGGTAIVKQNPVGNNMHNFDGMRWSDTANDAAYTNMNYFNSWVSYNAAFYPLQFRKRPDGLVHVRGFVGSGSFGGPAGILPEGCRPSHRILTCSVAADLFARVDIGADGSVTPMSGSSNVWASIDVLFAAGV